MGHSQSKRNVRHGDKQELNRLTGTWTTIQNETITTKLDGRVIIQSQPILEYLISPAQEEFADEREINYFKNIVFSTKMDIQIFDEEQRNQKFRPSSALDLDNFPYNMIQLNLVPFNVQGNHKLIKLLELNA